ncbi:MAG: ABC transporter permease [Dehalococcoidia bacterium]|nr:ABC transporter permease [Dehalococcoidia bacterium]
MNLRDSVQVMLSSASGRLGMVFLATLVLVSAYVLVRFPMDFGPRRWNNPAQWVDNPKAAPPVWWSAFRRDAFVPHVVLTGGEPSSGQIVGGQERLYTFAYDHGRRLPPTFMAFVLSDVRFFDRPPVVSVEVVRPDGRSVTLLQIVVRGPRLGESPPYLRYQEAPFRVNLSENQESVDAVSSMVRRDFGVALTPAQLQGKLEEALFGIPEEGSPGEFQSLNGTYQFNVRALVGNASDTLGGVKLILGGTAYGAMGTDALGRDLALGLLFGFPVALAIGVSTSLLATAIGTFLGIVSGFMGGKTDILIQRLSDVWSNIPLLPILIFLIFILGQKLWLVVVIMILFGWPGLTIVVRSMVLQIRTGQLVEATQALGASRMRIMFRHILFQIAPFVFAQMIFFTPAAILAEAGLSFLGLGDPSIPTWGQILESGFRTGAVYVGYWWWVLPPGLLIVATAMTFALVTLSLEPVLNPRLRTMR